MQTLRFERPEAARLYAGVPAEQVQQVLQFRADYPYRHGTAGGANWKWLATGSGERTILWLPGVLGTGASVWQVLPRLAERYRVIAPSYAAVDTMEQLAAGLAGVLDQEGVALAVVAGGSLGGMVAQVFVRRYPQRTEKLLLAQTGYPVANRVARSQTMLRGMALMPAGMIRNVFKQGLGELLPRDHPEAALIKAFFEEQVDFELTKEDLVASSRRSLDFDQHYSFTPHDLDGWPGEVLLLMAQDDPAVPAAIIQDMQALYPQAGLRLLAGAGHAAWLTRREEYLDIVREFAG